jgi:hypothetical protein
MEKCLKFRQGNGQTSVPLYLEEKVNLEEKKSWATPQQRDFKDAEPLAKWTERAEEQKAKGVNLHLPLPSQVMHTEEKQWATPNTMDCLPSRSYEAMKRQATNGGRKNRSKPGNLREQIDPLMCQAYEDAKKEANWATPIQGDSHLASTPEVAQKRIEEGKVTLSRQNPGKLNPRWVETLMGLPVGWVMPSCASPVTIEQTNCASSATESSLPPQSEHSELF